MEKSSQAAVAADPHNPPPPLSSVALVSESQAA